MRIKLTKTALEAVAAPAKGRLTIHDTEEPGLCVRVTSNDARAFYVVKRQGAKMIWRRLGTFDEMTIDQARRQAGDERTGIRNGINPNMVKRQAREAATLKDLWDSYLEGHARTHKRASSIAADEQIYKQHLEAWKFHRLTEITPELVDLLKTRIGKTSHTCANRTLALLSCMFRKRGHFFGLVRNWTPTAGLERFKERARDRVLSPEELGALVEAIKTEPNDGLRDFFLMALYTGARRSNVAAMRWEDISIQRSTWKIPGEVTKNGNPLVVELVPEALDVLKKRSDGSPFVFPVKRVTQDQLDRVKAMHAEGKATREIAAQVELSQTQVVRMLKPEFVAGNHGPLNGLSKAWKRILGRAGIKERTTIHDLRRTFCSAMVDAGVQLTTIAAAMGHKTLVTTQRHYAHARQDKVREAVRAGVGTMLAAAGIVSAPAPVAASA